MTNKVLELISHIMKAISNCSLYSNEHPAVLHLSERSVRVMDDLYYEDMLNFVILGNSLLLNEIPVDGKSIHVHNFIKKLRRKGIEKIVISKGVNAEELKGFISDMAKAEKISTTYPHISTGILKVKTDIDGDNLKAAMDKNISQVKEVYQGMSRFKKLDMVGLEDVVISFILTLKKEANMLKIISPVKSFSEYTYTHATNVAVISIFQAEHLGLKGEILHDIGIAGLLHDIGKTFVSKEILEKQSKLVSSEWEEMKKHPVYGAMYLSNLPDIPRIAVLVAFEHHMKYNGTGYPETKRRGKRQHLISQIITISDFFDALRTERPYREKIELPAITHVLHSGSGKDFNPILVNNFLHALKKINVF